MNKYSEDREKKAVKRNAKKISFKDNTEGQKENK